MDRAWWSDLSAKTGFTFEFAISKWSNSDIFLDDWVQSRIVWIDEEDQERVGESHQSSVSSILQMPKETRPFNTLMMWHKWQRFNNYVNFDDYTCIIKSRADIELDHEDINNLTKAILLATQEPNSLAIPAGGDYGKSFAGYSQGINDIFAIGRPQVMKKYLSIIHYWPEYYHAINFFHPETLLRFHLCDQNQIYPIRFPALLRLRGVPYNHRTKRWYRDTLKVRASFLERKIDRFKRLGKFF